MLEDLFGLELCELELFHEFAFVASGECLACACILVWVWVGFVCMCAWFCMQRTINYLFLGDLGSFLIAEPDQKSIDFRLAPHLGLKPPFGRVGCSQRRRLDLGVVLLRAAHPDAWRPAGRVA